MLTLSLLLLAMILTAALLQLNRNRLYKKAQIASLRARTSMLEERLRERTEQWRIANETLDHATRHHHQTTALLNETKEYLNSIINSMPSILIGVTPAGYVTHWNRAAEEATSLKENQALGFLVSEVYPALPGSLDLINNAIRMGSAQTHESLKYSIEDETHFFDVTVFPLMFSNNSGAVIRVDDVTLRVRLENMMIQNEKMLSLGELAAGMAHEINNPLAAIVQSLQNIQRRLLSDTASNRDAAEKSGVTLQQIGRYVEEREIRRFITGIQEASTRATTIVKNMLEFARASSKREAFVNINQALRQAIEFSYNTLEMSMPVFKDKLAIHFNPDMALPNISCNSAELQQVMVNLIKNAAQATQEARVANPHITVTTRHDNSHIYIDVSDNGIGMTAEVKRHIFDPFFTTKETGKGTGLGLSISYFIITERHHGRIDVDTVPGTGTTFTISLPIKT